MLMKKAKLFFSALLALVTIAATAQNVTVSGIVKDASTGEGVPFASVMVKGTTNGVPSDVNGNYTISAPSSAVLVVSAVGYSAVEVDVVGRTTINVTLEADVEFLEETVVVGYGSSKKVSSLVGSVQTVNSETLKNAPSSSALDQLQGQVAGLSVLSYSGVAGDNAVSMTLHGVGSLGASSTPLYVIDGIPSSSRSIMAMNPNDIESISILKDAAATSIYGSRAANGVVFVTTKAGSYNERASVTVRSQYGMSTLANTSIYENVMSGDELKDFWVRSGIYSADYIKSTFTDKGYTHNTQWYKYFMNLATPQYQNDVTIQGGGQKVAYMISASQFHQEGFTPGNFYDRYTVRSNVQARPAEWIKVGVNLNLSLDNTQQNPNWGSAANGMSNYTSGGLSFLLNPLYPAYDENGKVFEEKFIGLGAMNPNFYMENNTDQYDRYGANGTVFVELEPVRNLKFVSRAGVDGYFKLKSWQMKPSYAANYSSSSPYLGRTAQLEYSATITNTVEYSYEINHNNKFSVLAGQEGVANYYDYFGAKISGFTDDRVVMLPIGTMSTVSLYESFSESKFLSFFGHADYTLFDRYFFDATIRNDAVSRFGADVRNAMFWSAGARWNVKKESFLKNVRAINSLDFKASYGTQGNSAIGDYSSLGLISASGKYQESAGVAVTQPANAKLSWEQQALLTVGVSGRAFNALDFEVEFYQRKTSSMLMDVPNPYTTGFTETSQNVGSMQNTGVDVTLGVDIYRSADAFVRFNTTFNYNAQKITELFDGRKRWEIANTSVAYVVGNPVMFYAPIYAGIDPADGQMMWYVPGEDKDVTSMEETTKVFDEASLTQNTGKSRYAPINGGFSFSGGWKGLSVQADFTYVLGKSLLNNDAYFYGNPAKFAGNNTHKAMSDFWTPTNTDAKYPNWSTGATMQMDTHLLENASFLRLKNLQVAYSLPASFLGWTNGAVKDFKITLTGRNLLTATKYTGIDPEINSNLSYGVAGNSKQILGGIEITF